MTPAALLLAAVLAAEPVPPTIPAGANDWPQWRGPNRDGKSTAKGLLKEWPADGPKLLWKRTDVGTGYGTPAVVGDRFYLIGGDGNKAGEAEFLQCVSVETGKEIWKKPLGTAPGRYLDGWGGGPRSTPTVDGEFVYVLGSTGDLVAMSTKDGAKKWAKNLVSDFGGTIPTWGYAESPLIDGENLMVTPGTKTGVVALNKKTGATVWATKGLDILAGYSSLVITEVGGVRQYVQQSNTSRDNKVRGIAFGVAAKDGTVLWKAGELTRMTAVIPTPVLSGDYVFFTSGYESGCECYKLVPDGTGTKAVKVFSKYKALANHHGGAIVVDGNVYGHCDRPGNAWVCLAIDSPKDETKWSHSRFGKGSISYADGHFYCYSERDGELVRIKASPEAWEEAGRFKIPETSKKRPNQGRVWPHPVIAGGKLFLRDYDLLFVYDLRGGGA
jgi:outer membrane protein assembly factor BamB